MQCMRWHGDVSFKARTWTFSYNDETFGDIAECFLAMGFGVVDLPQQSHLPMDIQTAAVLLEKLVQDLYVVLCYFPLVT